MGTIQRAIFPPSTNHHRHAFALLHSTPSAGSLTDPARCGQGHVGAQQKEPLIKTNARSSLL